MDSEGKVRRRPDFSRNPLLLVKSELSSCSASSSEYSESESFPPPPVAVLRRRFLSGAAQLGTG